MRKVINLLIVVVLVGLSLEVYRLMDMENGTTPPESAVTRTRIQASVPKRDLEPADSFEQVSARSLFHPDREEFQEETPGEEVPPAEPAAIINVEDLFLQGTMIAEPARYAWILGPDDQHPKRYGVGDEINQFEIERILPDQVFLTTGEQRARLSLKTQWNSRGRGGQGAGGAKGRKGQAAATASGPRGAAVRTDAGDDPAIAARFKRQQMMKEMAEGAQIPPPPQFVPPDQMAGGDASAALPWGNLPKPPMSGNRLDSDMYDEPDYIVPLGEEGEIGLGEPGPPPDMFSGHPTGWEPEPPPPSSGEGMVPPEPPPDRPPRMSGM